MYFQFLLAHPAVLATYFAVNESVFAIFLYRRPSYTLKLLLQRVGFTMLHNLKRVATNGTKNESNKKIRKFRSMIEILNSPIKSQSDKKEYRLIKLPNGLTSLLVQHFIDNEGQTDDEDHQEKVSESDSKHSQESIESCPKDDSGDEEEDEEPKEKMAAVALCIKVGSWFDPSHIQGLSHFLEHMM